MTVWCLSVLWNIFLKLQCIPENITFPSFFYVLLSCSSFFTFFCFSAPILLWNQLNASCCVLLHALPPFILRFLFSLPCQFCIFEQLIKTQKGNMIFSFNLCGENGEELIWPKFVSPRAIDLIRRQQKERGLTWEVRATSPCRNFFYFINDKGKIEKD